jgi:ABC-type branched-subunit amino acid transport system substrate-binding protein
MRARCTKRPVLGVPRRSWTGVAASMGLASCLAVTAACGSGGGQQTGTGSAGDSASAGKPVNVMVIAPFTFAAAPSKANFDAVRVQAALQNAKGGINGVKVNVIGCDDQNDPDVAAQCAQQAVQDNVVALLGFFSLQSAAVWPVINTVHIPVIGLYQETTSDWTEANAWPVVPANEILAATTGNVLVKQLGCSKAAYIGLDFGADTTNATNLEKKVVEAAGGTYVGNFLAPATAAPGDFGPLAASALAKTNCLYVSGGAASNQIIQALYQQNPKVKIVGIDGGLAANWASATGPAAANVTQVGAIAPLTSKAPGAVAFVKEMKAMSPDSTLSLFSEMAWASWYAFYGVARTIKAGDLTASSLVAALGKATDVNMYGMTPNLNFTKNMPLEGVSRSFNNYVIIIRAHDGQRVQVGGPTDAASLIS